MTEEKRHLTAEEMFGIRGAALAAASRTGATREEVLECAQAYLTFMLTGLPLGAQPAVAPAAAAPPAPLAPAAPVAAAPAPGGRAKKAAAALVSAPTAASVAPPAVVPLAPTTAPAAAPAPAAVIPGPTSLTDVIPFFKQLVQTMPSMDNKTPGAGRVAALALLDKFKAATLNAVPDAQLPAFLAETKAEIARLSTATPAAKDPLAGLM